MPTGMPSAPSDDTVRLALTMQPQPTDTSCGPACLRALYHFWGDRVELDHLQSAIQSLDAGGTLDVFLANHALERGYRARIHTLNLRLFDPTWFHAADQHTIAERLLRQAQVHRNDDKLQTATSGYRRFLELGGELRFGDISAGLIKRYLRRGVPVLTGLSATYLYANARENPTTCEDDPIAGRPVGHFVVLMGYHGQRQQIIVADPYRDHTMADTEGDQIYRVPQDRLLGAVFLGVLSWDANLLVIEPATKRAQK